MFREHDGTVFPIYYRTVFPEYDGTVFLKYGGTFGSSLGGSMNFSGRCFSFLNGYFEKIMACGA